MEYPDVGPDVDFLPASGSEASRLPLSAGNVLAG